MKFEEAKDRAASAEKNLLGKLGVEQPVSPPAVVPHEVVPQPRAPPRQNDADIFDAAILEGMKQRRIFGYDTRSKACVAYLAMTIPRFSESEEVIEHVSKGLAEKHPNLWARVNAAIDRLEPKK